MLYLLLDGLEVWPRRNASFCHILAVLIHSICFKSVSCWSELSLLSAIADGDFVWSDFGDFSYSLALILTTNRADRANVAPSCVI